MSRLILVHVYRRKDAADGFRLTPFWKQWNAVLHVNVQKQKKPHGNVIIIPAGSVVYYPNSGAFSALGGHVHGAGLGPVSGLGNIGPVHGIGAGTNGIHGGPGVGHPVGPFGGSPFPPQFDTVADAPAENMPPKVSLLRT